VNKDSVTEIAFPDRQFRLWRFISTHSQLLLQSQADEHSGHLYRIEVLFPGVAHMSLPPYLDALHVRKAAKDSAAGFEGIVGAPLPPDVDVYLIHPQAPWFVISEPPSWVQAIRTYSDPSVFFPEGWSIDPEVVVHTLT
jgi:hypothetical protein